MKTKTNGHVTPLRENLQSTNLQIAKPNLPMTIPGGSQIVSLSENCLPSSPEMLQEWARVVAQLGCGFTFQETITLEEKD